MINLQESMGPGRDRTRDPWNCSQSRICSQTRYRLRYGNWVCTYLLMCRLIDILYCRYGVHKGLTSNFI